MLSSLLLLLSLSVQHQCSNPPCYDQPRLYTESQRWAIAPRGITTPPRRYNPFSKRVRIWRRCSVIARTGPGVPRLMGRQPALKVRVS